MTLREVRPLQDSKVRQYSRRRASIKKDMREMGESFLIYYVDLLYNRWKAWCRRHKVEIDFFEWLLRREYAEWTYEAFGPVEKRRRANAAVKEAELWTHRDSTTGLKWFTIPFEVLLLSKQPDAEYEIKVSVVYSRGTRSKTFKFTKRQRRTMAIKPKVARRR